MNKIIRVIFSPEAKQVYCYLNEQSKNSKNENMIFNAVNHKISLIKTNIHYGNAIAKRLIPQEYKTKYGITNLFRVELPRFWRMLYTLTDGENEIEIIAFVLDVIGHKKYNQKLGYKK